MSPSSGERGLYRSLAGGSSEEGALLWVLSLADGRTSLLEIADRSGLDLAVISGAAMRLEARDLLKRNLSTRRSHVALVTGGGSGVGLEIARALGVDGHAVAIMGRSRERLAIAKKALHSDVPEVSTFEGDVRDAASVDAVVRGVNDGLGSIDVVVHAAGVSAAIGCTWEVDPLVWRDDLDTSVLGAFVLAQRVVPKCSIDRLVA